MTMEESSSLYSQSSNTSSFASQTFSTLNQNNASLPTQPKLSLAPGGGALRSIDEKLATTPTDGSATFSISLHISSSRSGFTPLLNLHYHSGMGNSPFGLGWDCGLPSISRSTNSALPTYQDRIEKDKFTCAGIEDLVPLYQQTPAGTWERVQSIRNGYLIHPYRFRTERHFQRIERWTSQLDGISEWHITSPDNVVSIYGNSPQSRIADPTQPSHIFTWLLSQSYDQKGNAILYIYKEENADGLSHTRPQEQTRRTQTTFPQRYLKHVYYCNATPYYGETPLLPSNDWLMEVVLDYGEHHANTPEEDQPWLCRHDPFSSFRPGFDLRTYRLCQRILQFHRFPELGTTPCLIHATELTYHSLRNDASDIQAGNPRVTLLASSTFRGYQRHTNQQYTSKATPPVEYFYSLPAINQAVQTLDSVSLQNIPEGASQQRNIWVDLYGEGLVGILSEQAESWFFKPNLGNGTFGALQSLPTRPHSQQGLRQGALQLADLRGSGLKDIVSFQAPLGGLFPQDEQGQWSGFQPFSQQLTLNLRHPDVLFLDLTGDGTADLLLTETDQLLWYPSLGPDGYGACQHQPLPLTEESGPRLVWRNNQESLFIADMTGDGLIDLVRIRNGEISYWPNMGYGHFGPKIVMDHAPHFDHPDLFQHERLRLADIDGSGTADLLYLGREHVTIYANECGNSWSDPEFLPPLPSLVDLVTVEVLDLLGNGTACLVWSSPLPEDTYQPLRSISLMGNTKPLLLNRYLNNMGKEVSIAYKPSTSYALADKQAGHPWQTRLPFPIQCVSEVTERDHIQQTVFVCSYTYHHGYYDGQEREFRGFARVDSLDTQEYQHFVQHQTRNSVEQTLHQPPVLTKTWYHLGVFPGQQDLFHHLQQEYHQDPLYLTAPLEHSSFPENLSTEELRQAFRALKGNVLHQEVYSHDGTSQDTLPYSTSTSNYEVSLLQPGIATHLAIFQVLGKESLNFVYERQPLDPRLTQTLILAHDLYGQSTQVATIIYPRHQVDSSLPLNVQQMQGQGHIITTELDYTNDVVQEKTYRLRVPYNVRHFELTGLTFSSLHTQQSITNALQQAQILAYELQPGSGLQKRLISQQRTYYQNEQCTGDLPLGVQTSHGIPALSLDLAMTAGLVTQQLGDNVTDAELSEAGYIHSEHDTNWWIPSVRAFYAPDPQLTFFQPTRFRDPLGAESSLTFDPYLLYAITMTDAFQHQVRARYDYRLLAITLLTDANQNRTAIETDELGFMIKRAVMGKEGANEGDTLDEPTEIVQYDLFRWQSQQLPNVHHHSEREQHGVPTPWQESYSYLDGSGQSILTKAQATPGLAKRWNNTSQILEEVDTSPNLRWIGNGRTIVNNKGKPVKQYEPYFSTTPEFEDEAQLTELGVTAIHTYDALGRNIRTDLPNGTFRLVEFDSWLHIISDENDTVLESQWYQDRNAPNPQTPEPADAEQRAAWQTTRHAKTPAIYHLDSLGRSLYCLSDNGDAGVYAVRAQSDLSGHVTRMFDQKERLVIQGLTNMIGQPLSTDHAEKGVSRILADVMGNLFRKWDENQGKLTVQYDQLHRPLSMTYTNAEFPQGFTFFLILYGDQLTNAATHNLIGRPCQIYDQSGALTIQAIDFQGNATNVSRQFTQRYDLDANWQNLVGLTTLDQLKQAASTLLAAEIFQGTAHFDALNRPTQVTFPDQTVVSSTYNASGSLDTLHAQLQGQGQPILFVSNQEYNARGQRLSAIYGNQTIATSFYDPHTFRLTSLFTRKTSESTANSIQALQYTYDPVGNLTTVIDDAQQTFYFRNAVVKPEQRFTYDAIYRLRNARGREHAGLNGPPDNTDIIYQSLPEANNATAVQTYAEDYSYDELGNLLDIKHTTNTSSWRRFYHYAYQDDPNNRTNRLTQTSLPGDATTGPYSLTYGYDAQGHMTQMPQVGTMHWNVLEQLRIVNLGGGGTAYYQSSGSGRRMRKVIERSAGLREERFYLGPLEIYRKYQGGTLKVERHTLHITDQAGCIAQIDTKTIDLEGIDTSPLQTPIIRYQLGNHLGSVHLELDEQGNPVSYEEYHPFGSTSYRSSKPDVNQSLKRYRFAHKERDNETGLYCFGVRYYAAWLGRWTSPDPAGLADGMNHFAYARNNPVTLFDPNGFESKTMHETFQIPPDLLAKQKTTAGKIQAAHDYLVGRTFTEDGQEYRITSMDNIKPPDKPGGRWTSTFTYEAVTPAPPPEETTDDAGSGMEITIRGGDGDKKTTASGASPPDTATTSPTVPPAANPSAKENDSGSNASRVASGAIGYLSHETQIAYAVRMADNAKKALIGANIKTILQNLPAEYKDLDALYRIARAAFATRNLSRTASQEGLLPIGRFLTSLLDKSGKAERSFGQLLETQIARKGGDLAKGFEAIAEGAGKANKTATKIAKIGNVGGRVLGALGFVLSAIALHDDLANENYGVVVGDVAGIVSGGLAIAGMGPAALAVGGIALANAAGDWVGGMVEAKYGRTAGVVAGTAAGALTGAGIGFLVAGPVGAVVGGAIGAIAGFIGSFW